MREFFFNVLCTVLFIFHYFIFLADIHFSKDVPSVRQVIEANKRNDQKVIIKYFDFYLQTKDARRRAIL